MEALCSICHARLGQATEELREALIRRELLKAGRTEWREATAALLLSPQAPEPIRQAQQEVAALFILIRHLGHRPPTSGEEPPF